MFGWPKILIWFLVEKDALLLLAILIEKICTCKLQTVLQENDNFTWYHQVYAGAELPPLKIKDENIICYIWAKKFENCFCETCCSIASTNQLAPYKYFWSQKHLIKLGHSIQTFEVDVRRSFQTNSHSQKPPCYVASNREELRFASVDYSIPALLWTAVLT